MRNDEIKATIREAVEAGRIAGRQQAKDLQEATKRRLAALPILRDKIAEETAQLEETRLYGAKTKSKSVTRFSASGSRLTPEEIQEALILDAEATIAADTLEVEKMERLLDKVKEDLYYRVLEGRYIDGLTDENLADELHCEVRTIQRNRQRLIEDLTVWLYGSFAL